MTLRQLIDEELDLTNFEKQYGQLMQSLNNFSEQAKNVYNDPNILKNFENLKNQGSAIGQAMQQAKLEQQKKQQLEQQQAQQNQQNKQQQQDQQNQQLQQVQTQQGKQLQQIQKSVEALAKDKQKSAINDTATTEINNLNLHEALPIPPT